MSKTEMPEKIKKAVAGVLDLFRSPDLPQAIARAVFPNVGKPLSAWSISNKLICVVDWIITKYNSEYSKLETAEERGVFLGKHIGEGFEKSDYRGFNQWKEKERRINKGSSATYILAPMFYKGSRNYKTVDGKKHYVRGEEAKGVGVQSEEYQFIKGFRGIPVFRSEDTNGKPIVNKELKLPQLPFMPVADFLGIKVVPEAFKGRAYGSYSPTFKIITLATPNQATFFHELAHAVDDYLMIQKTGKGLKGGQQADQEIVADFTGSVLAFMIGYKVEQSVAKTKGYVTHYADGEDPEEAVVKLLGRIEKVVDFITNFKQAKSPSRQMEERTGEPPTATEKLADNPPKAKGVDVDGVGKKAKKERIDYSAYGRSELEQEARKYTKDDVSSWGDSELIGLLNSKQ